MRYRHIKNGAVIDIPNVLTSPDWERVQEDKYVTDKAPKDKPMKKAGLNGKRIRNGK